MYKKKIKYILILIILILVLVNLIKNKKIIFDDIMILGLWNEAGEKNEYEITQTEPIQIDIFNTICNGNRINKKIAPGSYGKFTIRFKRPSNCEFEVKLKEKTRKPQNLIFILDNKKYISISEMEKEINEKLLDEEKIIINWVWEYHVNEIEDIEDTDDGENAQKYIFEINSIIEDEERN